MVQKGINGFQWLPWQEFHKVNNGKWGQVYAEPEAAWRRKRHAFKLVQRGEFLLSLRCIEFRGWVWKAGTIKAVSCQQTDNSFDCMLKKQARQEKGPKLENLAGTAMKQSKSWWEAEMCHSYLPANQMPCFLECLLLYSCYHRGWESMTPPPLKGCPKGDLSPDLGWPDPGWVITLPSRVWKLAPELRGMKGIPGMWGDRWWGEAMLSKLLPCSSKLRSEFGASAKL